MCPKALTAEFIGTFALIFIGAGTGALASSLVAVALAHGLVILTFALAYGRLSGAHFNPAVTIGLWLGRVIKAPVAAAYIVVQLAAGIIAAAILNYALGSSAGTLGATTLAEGIPPLSGAIIEGILTFFLVSVIFSTAVSGKSGNLAPIAIGLTLAGAILMGGSVTGASLNPARTIGPAVITGTYSNIWVYIVGPILGGMVAAILYTFFLKSAEEPAV
ncbi:aquaporin [Endozoicomonas euniceicola]|uniref:Aquaporin n=1 Tax=Endozoicomonas euniceicola TaxID=1234143 RepID=A0ABY6GSS9_9GAMM|nr:aquaporin [Endozoicomonas euniceicola]UYM15820.1 aquaporin [Endozoicomonas euniceicola]